MSDNLQKMFIEDAPQDLDNLKGVENLSTLVLELQKLEDEIKEKEDRLKSTKEKADKLSQVAIPEIMEALKMKTMKLTDGSAIEIKEIYSATIPLITRKALITGFESMAWVILLKMRLPFPLVVAKTTRLANMQTLQKGMGSNQLKS